jgi:hypothetical protein
MPVRKILSSLSLLAIMADPAWVYAASPDAGLFASYFFGNNYTSVAFLVCGSLPGTEGCYGSGEFGPFGHAGALIEGNPAVSGNVVTRSVYVVDIAAGTSGDQVVLYRYLRTDTISGGNAQVTSTLTKTLPLPLAGGATARCSIAGNGGFLFVGTDQSPFALRLTKGSLAMTKIGGFSNNPTVASITADNAGYVTVSFGGNSGGPGGNVQFGPNGESEGDGGGALFLLNTQQGLSSKDLPTLDGDEPSQVKLHVNRTVKSTASAVAAAGTDDR